MSTDQLHQENARLRRAIDELSTLNELAKSIAVMRDAQEIMQTIVRRSLRAVGARQGVITLVHENTKDPMHTLVRTMVSTEHTQFHFHQALLGWMYLNKKPLIINDPKHDDRFHDFPKDVPFENLLAVPMVVKSRLTGVLTVYGKPEEAGGAFSEEDARLLSILAGQSAQVVENARLEEEERELKVIQQEMTMAGRIQMDLLPKHPPVIAGYDIAASTIPAKLVGGDYFDFIELGQGKVALCLGDVSGKGMPAALLMAHLQATLRATLQGVSNPQEVLDRANQLLFNSTSPEKFATLFMAILDSGPGILLFGNAGHDPGLLLRADSRVEDLEASGLPIGMFEGMAYTSQTISLRPNDVLVVYTDGIAETRNSADLQFGREGIIKAVTSHRERSADEIQKAILDSVNSFSDNAPLFDDRTLMVVKCLSTTP